MDTLGLILSLVVHPASVQDRDGAVWVLRKLRGTFPRLRRIWADGGYAGRLVKWAKTHGGWALEIVKRSDHLVGFTVLPQRWIVERTPAWLGRYRRLSKDCESLPDRSEWMIHLAMINLTVHRLIPG